MRFITVHDSAGKDFTVNASQILRVIPVAPNGSEIHFVGGTSVSVTEPFEKVRDMANQFSEDEIQALQSLKNTLAEGVQKMK